MCRFFFNIFINYDITVLHFYSTNIPGKIIEQNLQKIVYRFLILFQEIIIAKNHKNDRKWVKFTSKYIIYIPR